MADIQDIINSARESIKGYLSRVDPDFQEYDTGMFTFQEGSAIIGVTIRPWDDDSVVVEFSSQLVNGATLNDETLHWLMKTNVDIHFGAFGLLFDNSVVYSHSIPFEGLTEDTFAAVARTVAAIADHYDDEIVSVAGGQLASLLSGDTEIDEPESAATT